MATHPPSSVERFAGARHAKDRIAARTRNWDARYVPRPRLHCEQNRDAPPSRTRVKSDPAMMADTTRMFDVRIMTSPRGRGPRSTPAHCVPPASALNSLLPQATLGACIVKTRAGPTMHATSRTHSVRGIGMPAANGCVRGGFPLQAIWREATVPPSSVQHAWRPAGAQAAAQRHGRRARERRAEYAHIAAQRQRTSPRACLCDAAAAEPRACVAGAASCMPAA
jgi:hypothetical protein